MRRHKRHCRLDIKLQQGEVGYGKCPTLFSIERQAIELFEFYVIIYDGAAFKCKSVQGKLQMIAEIWFLPATCLVSQNPGLRVCGILHRIPKSCGPSLLVDEVISAILAVHFRFQIPLCA